MPRTNSGGERNDEDMFVRRPASHTQPENSGNRTDNPQAKADYERRVAQVHRTVQNPANIESTPPKPVETKKRKAKNIDMVFLVVLIMLLGFGAVMNFSASYAYATYKNLSSYYFLERQLMFIFFGFIAAAIVTLFPLETYKTVTFAVYGIAIILLLLVLVIGETHGGAKRWLNIPLLGQFQPSELGKTAVVMMLALYFSKFGDIAAGKNNKKAFLYGMIIPGLILGIIGGIVAFEPHFSGLIIICCIGATVMILGGTKMRFIIPIAIVAAIGIYIVIKFKNYALDRLDYWLDPWEDASGKGWQTIQGLYAIASGGLFGVGLGNSRQKYGYVSEPQNDFVFTIVCEELGFVGALIVILLFAVLIWRGFVIARHAPSRFTSLIVYGLMTKVAIQVIFNIAVVTQLFPNTGIALPFFSSGGTAMLMQMAEMGIVLSVSRYSNHRK